MMSNLTLIKPQVYEVRVAKKSYPLRYDLTAFAFIEERLDSVVEAIELFNKKDTGAITVIFQAGLLREKVDAHKIIKRANLDELINIITKALSETTCAAYGFDKEFDWQLLYFIARPALGFSDEEFWSSTPKKILTMMKMLEETKKDRQTEEALTGNEAVQTVMSW